MVVVKDSNPCIIAPSDRIAFQRALGLIDPSIGKFWGRFWPRRMDNNTEKAYAPIAARERGPGPGRYRLPPTIGFMGHDLTKHMNPAYTFGRKHSGALYYNSCSPGPRYYVDPKITRFGRNGTPSHSMAARAKTRDLSQIPGTPGPGAYNPECTPHLNEHRSPAYTMGSRTRYRKLDTVPAPNSYTLPSLMGPKVPTKPSSACFSVTGRTRREDLSKTPGPGRYNRTDPNIYLRKQPVYTMLGRHDLPTYCTQTPGPGAHSPEKVTITNPNVPAFSLGMRHSEYVTPLIIDISD